MINELRHIYCNIRLNNDLSGMKPVKRIQQLELEVQRLCQTRAKVLQRSNIIHRIIQMIIQHTLDHSLATSAEITIWR